MVIRQYLFLQWKMILVQPNKGYLSQSSSKIFWFIGGAINILYMCQVLSRVLTPDMRHN